MPHQLTNAAQSLLKKAAEKLPATTGETARVSQRLASAGTATVIVADVSGSMDGLAGGKKKIAILAEAVDDVMRAVDGARLIIFGSDARISDWCEEWPAPAGGTALHLALDLAATLRPKRTLVVSDGQPDDAAAALAAAEKLPGQIDVIYCGRDDDAAAIAFMRRLARAGAGTCVVHDLRRPTQSRLAQPMRALLALPAMPAKE